MNHCLFHDSTIRSKALNKISIHYTTTPQNNININSHNCQAVRKFHRKYFNNFFINQPFQIHYFTTKVLQLLFANFVFFFFFNRGTWRVNRFKESQP